MFNGLFLKEKLKKESNEEKEEKKIERRRKTREINKQKIGVIQ